MAVTRPTESVRNAQCDALVDQLDNGFLRYTVGAGGSVAAECRFGTPAFGDAAAGIATANAITPDSAAAGNASPVTHADLISSGGTVVIARCEVSGPGGGGDIIISSTTINNGDEVDTQSLTYETAP